MNILFGGEGGFIIVEAVEFLLWVFAVSAGIGMLIALIILVGVVVDMFRN